MIELFDNIESDLAGFRLQYLEVLNWGTFHQVRWIIQPNGQNALLTGDIGSGKSTLVDAVTCLLVPHHKIIFNKAAGAESKERNLLSYVKGEYKKEKEEITRAARKVYLRPDDNTYTVIIGNFFNEGYNENVCLAQIFWIGKDSKVEKLLVIGTIPLSIQDHFSNFTDINDLRKRLRASKYIHLFNDNFTQYSEQFRRLFGMNSDKAIDLFYQTVSMKSVSSLTDFVREQMLERTDVKEQIGSLLKRFEDLKKSHEAVVHAREQYGILKPLTEACELYEEVIRQIEKIEVMLEVMPVWFAEKKWLLLKASMENAQLELQKLANQHKQISDELEALERRKQSILLDIANQGGKRIEQIAEEIKRHEQNKIEKSREFSDYEKLSLQACLKKIEKEEDFEENRVMAGELNTGCNQVEIRLREERDLFMGNLRRYDADHQLESAELDSLKERKTQIPAWLISFRLQLCKDLRIDESDLPFAGELLQVNVAEADWQGAIEKLLRNAGISLLVPEHLYKSVSNYVNENRLQSPDGRGIKVTYLQIGGKTVERFREPDADSVFFKIDIKPDSIFHDWLEIYLQKSFGDYVCTDVTGLARVHAGLTREGLIKSGRIRHTKDDRRSIGDRRNYVLGWSNAEKIKALENSVQQIWKQLSATQGWIKEVEEQERSNRDKKVALSILLSIQDYSKINWQHHVEKIYDLDKERNELLNNNDLLGQLQINKNEVDENIAEAKSKEASISEKTGANKSRLTDYEEQLSAALMQKDQLLPAQKEAWYPQIEKEMQDISLTIKNIGSRQEELRKRYQGENGELKKLRGRQMGLRSSVERKMREIKEHSKAEYSEITESIDARQEYIKKYTQLVSEDLKRHEERFKVELNKNVINSIAVFDSQLQKHENEIKQKISMINRHLSEIEYNAAQNTYITILMDPSYNKDVRLFKENLKKCYVHSFSQDTKLYTEEKYEQVKRILDRFASMESADREWTNTVTDVRHWFEFNATERYREDNSEKEFYEGSGGKSGGQKEKLAYTILASALAYQFGLQFGETKSRSFRFVVIDEAFGRGSDESTRYGLELFKKLNLQLLIVTPLQKIHVIENHVHTFHFISNREGNNSQVNNFTKLEYEHQKRQHQEVTQNAVTE